MTSRPARSPKCRNRPGGTAFRRPPRAAHLTVRPRGGPVRPIRRRRARGYGAASLSTQLRSRFVSTGRISTIIRRVGLPVALAAIGTISLAAGVFAASINEHQLPTTALAFEDAKNPRAHCEGPLENLDKSLDGW